MSGEGRGAHRLCRSSNHCFAGNTQLLGEASPVAPPRAPESRKRRSSEVTGASKSSPRKKRLYPIDKKVDILKKYVKWREAGASHFVSSIPDLKKKYPGMGKNYPKFLYDKMLKHGSVENLWGDGRPVDYTEAVWEEMVRIIREHRAKQLAPSGRTIRNELCKVFHAKDVPSTTTINEKKREMKFRAIKVDYKPVLTKKKMEGRLEYAKSELTLRRASSGKHAKWRLTVVIDEKWFTEEKPTTAKFLARADSPINDVKFKSKSKETKTQLVKLMYLCAVSPTVGPIGYYKLNWTHHVRYNPKTGREEPAKVDSALLKPIWKKIHAAAAIKFGQGHDIRLVMDKAPSHKSKATAKNVKDAGFDELVLQAPTSPDFSMLDASIFPSLEKECNDQGAQTADEIEKAVKVIWRRVNKKECEKAAKRVELNMEESIKLKGGNYYSEGRKRKRG